MRAAEIITELQSLGLRVEAGLSGRRGGAGPAEGGTLVVQDRVCNAPTASPFVADSPWSLDQSGPRPMLMRQGRPVCPVELVALPRFYAETTPEGVALKQIALLHGRDCLASTVQQGCAFWEGPLRCSFCGIGLSLASGQTLASKTPEQLALAAKRAQELDGVTQVVLTTGGGVPAGSEIKHLAACAAAIKAATGLPIHAQYLPPPFERDQERLQAAGVDTVGIHIESLDPRALAQHAPVKAGLGLDRFLAAWRQAVELFGPGQVSSFLIAGLGEEPESLLAGCQLLAEMGVYPFLLPLRPIPGSLLAQARPPAPEYMAGLYQEAAKILQATGLSARESKAGCVRCGACSAIAAWELAPAELVCHPARTAAELQAALDIRRQVFVAEQGIVQDTDQDQADQTAIHLVARRGGRVVGTVRVFPQAERPGQWVGGRLAVAAGERRGGVGAALVREAVRTVARRGCTRFTATVQQANVPFFQRLGWTAEGETIDIHGWPHQLMVADLDQD
ncbi:MAG: MSMEG_0568 family radical SAM protein [Thermodesulfobacteriota bacterium]